MLLKQDLWEIRCTSYRYKLLYNSEKTHDYDWKDTINISS